MKAFTTRTEIQPAFKLGFGSVIFFLSSTSIVNYWAVGKHLALPANKLGLLSQTYSSAQVVLVFALVGICICLIILKTYKYIVRKDMLIISIMGLPMVKLPINYIKSINKNWKPRTKYVSGGIWGLSYNYIVLHLHDGDFLRISPGDRKGLVEALLRINRNIQV